MWCRKDAGRGGMFEGVEMEDMKREEIIGRNKREAKQDTNHSLPLFSAPPFPPSLSLLRDGCEEMGVCAVPGGERRGREGVREGRGRLQEIHQANFDSHLLLSLFLT